MNRTSPPALFWLFMSAILLLAAGRSSALCADDAPTDEQLLTLTQRATFRYFWDGAEPVSGLSRERIHLDDPTYDQDVVTSGGTGFGLMAILVGIERNFVTRTDVVTRLETMLTALEKADRFHGAWPHWLYGPTGKVKPFSPKDDGGDLVETSYLAAGLLCVRQYFRDGSEREQRLAAVADRLWREIEWDWYRGPDRENVLFWHWSPKHAWEMNFRIRGYNECLITYVLAGASPTHGIPPEVYHEGWAENGAIRQTSAAFGIELKLRHQGVQKYCGPLFWAHYSYLGLDPRELRDRYADYWEQNRNHVAMCKAYCVENPGHHDGYSSKCWGLTSSYSLEGYAGHSPEHDEGTIAPTAALSSFPCDPDSCMAALRYFHDELGDRLLGTYGFYDAFNQDKDWFPRQYLAIDQGPEIIMIENYRSGLIWKLFMSAPEVQHGLTRLGFEVNGR